MNIKKSILIRVRVAFLLVALFAVAVVVRMGNIQFVEGDKWKKLAEEIGFQYRTIKATRGNIYSDNGSLLATSLPFYKVAFDPMIADSEVFKKGIDSLSLLLSKTFPSTSARQFKQKITDARLSGKRYITLSREQIDYQQKKKMMDWPIFREGRHEGGVIFEKVDKRFRPFNDLAFRTVGFLNEDNYGAGLEYSFNDLLGGRDGEALYQKMAGGSWKPVFDQQEVKPEEGLDIETTLDVNLQDVAETALLRALEEHSAQHGAVVVMEVSTGAIKAISNLTRLENGSYGETYNYFVGGVREPGSTFKLVSMMALFEDTNLSLEDSIDTGTGEIKVYKESIRDHKPGGYGKITIQEAFEKSSNIAVAKLVMNQYGTQPKKFYEYIESLGLNRPIGFQMKGEGEPKVKTPDKWSGITLPWMAFGYEVETTPLQMLTLYNAVANEGRMMKPYIVSRAKRADKVIRDFKPEILKRQICSDATLEKLKIMLEGVVERGTADNINGTHYKIAGKTGTAQKLVNGKHVKKYYTSFVGYFPADNPRYSCMVLIDDPKGYRQYGSDVAAPVFKEIADKIYAKDIDMHAPLSPEYLVETGVFPTVKAGYYPDLNFLCNKLGISNHSKEDEVEWVRASVTNNAINWKYPSNAAGLVPDVQGMMLRDALYLLENKGLRVTYQGKGRVINQSLPPGSRIAKGGLIRIILG
ncbi:penicillin-binding protein [Cytophagales bacterium LB-30]|uniref:Penicillin-binding protein n=1 Tax=Shiella aurantiaca TaxID=3058365 RepID=A0ABT8F1W4_9BACT|nr:penicillin-binding protein [Shiella aurantiaca]MDN4164430.1 penicillin-binding protein [Shiella aurantiaca]